MKINIKDITLTNRIRSDMGDMGDLVASIKKFGLLQPIVLNATSSSTHVTMGGRRFTALKIIGLKELEHGVHFIWLDEQNKDPDRQVAVELEENLKRKDLSWSEIALGRQKLLETMQRIHGPAKQFGEGGNRGVVAGKARGYEGGFGNNKLAAMLGESPAQTSKLLTLADALTAVPSLAKAPTMQAALRAMKTAKILVDMKQPSPACEPLWSLHEGDFRDASTIIPPNSVDLVYVDPPFGVNFDDNPHTQKAGRLNYQDSPYYVVNILNDLCRLSYSILRPDRYAVVWFGFAHYCELVSLMRQAGFTVNMVPYVWYTTRRENPNPFLKYTSSYQTALVAWKGGPVMLRPGRENYCTVKPVPPAEKLRITQQPVELVKEFLLDMTTENAHVVDFCAGAGTTGVAAVQLGRKVTMFEHDDIACRIIRNRMVTLK